MNAPILAPRTALFLPASNPRAIAKAATLRPDLIILDLEDAVAEADKDRARDAAVTAVAGELAGKRVAIRVNGTGHPAWSADVDAVMASPAAFIVLPKVEGDVVVPFGDKPVLAMIETPRGVLDAPAIAAMPAVAGLIAGTNDLMATLGMPLGGMPPGSGRAGLTLALQSIVLAARAGRVWALDGVFNALDDPEGLAAECREGRSFGFDGKTLIHPNQIEVAAAAFGPSEAELAEARALIAAASGGAQRFRDRMIEAMHVDQARALIARAGG